MFLVRSFSHHSLLSAVPKIPDLIKAAKEKGYTTIALTDDETASGFVEFHEECKKQDMKGTVGVTVKIPNLTSSEGTFGRHKAFSKIAIIAKNNTGYKHLLEIVSVVRTVQEEPTCHATFDNLKPYFVQDIANLFVVICGNDHEFVTEIRNGKITSAKSILSSYIQLMKPENIIVEVAAKLDSETEEENQKVNKSILQICKELNVKPIASNAPRYIDKDDKDVFRIVLAIRDGKRIGDISLTRDFHLPHINEQKQVYEYAPEAIETQEIEDQIDLTIRTDYDKHADEAFFPKFDLPEGQNSSDRLRWETYTGFVGRFAPIENSTIDPDDNIAVNEHWKVRFPYEDLEKLITFAHNITPDSSQLRGYPSDYWHKQHTVKDYIDRMETELNVIITKGYPAYFLVLADVMDFCKKNSIVTNTRGSAAGCLVGYLIRINILDPLVYDIPFERFLNPLRPSAPDIDGDFADDKRELVIQYLTKKYGSENVCQIITFGTMLPRAAVRDVGRALGVSYKKCDRLAKLIPAAPQGKKATFKWALEASVELAEVYDKDEEAKQIIDIAKKIEANYRHSSSHAAGLIITPTKLTDYAPLQWDSEHKMIISQYDMKVSEKIGLVKMDLLGIRNLAILGNAVELAEEREHTKIDLLNIDLSDKKAFELLSKGRTMGLFQLSGPAMTRYLVEMEPNRVQDLMAMVALYRPGPMANIPDYIKRKNNPKYIKYYVPQMEKWMKESYGILVYQDDLLYTVINLAGYDWAEADTFRKGVGKKVQAILESQHTRFVDGCIEKSNMTREQAEALWDLMVPFAAYGFNKAHASSYGMIAYWTAYMKAEYTVEFMTALMTSEAANLDKVAAAIAECKELGISVLPPDVNKSFDSFTIQDNKTIRYGLASVKNLGSDVIRCMIEERNSNGSFTDTENFIDRMSTFQGFNKRSLEALIWSGSLDNIGLKSFQSIIR